MSIKTIKAIAKVAGVILVGVAALPTPDDLTVISPIVQGAVGVGLIAWSES